MTLRKVKQIIEPKLVVEGAGVLLRRSIAPSRANPFDPFLLFDHFAFNDPREGPIVGFPMHPHRGIETVTYMLDGFTRHRDSLGNSGVIGPGDVQWMTSGRGILHEEMPKRGPSGLVNGFQLWVNLPASEKMGQPRYQEVTASSIPAAKKDGVKVRVVAGKYGETHGPVTEIIANPLYMDVTLEPGKEFQIAVPEKHTVVAYLFEGKAAFGNDETMIEAVRLLEFDEGVQVRACAGENGARLMLIAGAAINEPIVPYGPFVMNTEAEIRQTLLDIRNGTFVANYAQVMRPNPSN